MLRRVSLGDDHHVACVSVVCSSMMPSVFMGWPPLSMCIRSSSTDIWVVSFEYCGQGGYEHLQTCLFGAPVFSLLLEKYLREQLLGCMVSVCLRDCYQFHSTGILILIQVCPFLSFLLGSLQLRPPLQGSLLGPYPHLLTQVGWGGPSCAPVAPWLLKLFTHPSFPLDRGLLDNGGVIIYVSQGLALLII